MQDIFRTVLPFSAKIFGNLLPSSDQIQEPKYIASRVRNNQTTNIILYRAYKYIL